MGDLRRLAAWAVAGACSLAVAPRAGAAIAFGQLDDFQGVTTMGWMHGPGSSNPPANVATGGPGGAADGFLKITSNGIFGPGSKLVAFNQSRWSGDFNAAGVTRIDAQLANFGATDLFMRLAIRGGIGTSYGSTAAVTLPAGSGWRSVTFNLGAASMTALGGPDTLDAVLASVTELRLLSAQAGPNFMGDTVAASLGVDGVRALRLPGDANFDGTVGFPDLVTVAQHYDATGATWADGDFNFDGLVGFPDLVTVAQNYDSRGPAAAVPEPTGIISGVAAFLLVARRRRRD